MLLGSSLACPELLLPQAPRVQHKEAQDPHSCRYFSHRFYFVVSEYCPRHVCSQLACTLVNMATANVITSSQLQSIKEKVISSFTAYFVRNRCSCEQKCPIEDYFCRSLLPKAPTRRNTCCHSTRKVNLELRGGRTRWRCVSAVFAVNSCCLPT